MKDRKGIEWRQKETEEEADDEVRTQSKGEMENNAHIYQRDDLIDGEFLLSPELTFLTVVLSCSWVPSAVCIQLHASMQLNIQYESKMDSLDCSYIVFDATLRGREI